MVRSEVVTGGPNDSFLEWVALSTSPLPLRTLATPRDDDDKGTRSDSEIVLRGDGGSEAELDDESSLKRRSSGRTKGRSEAPRRFAQRSMRRRLICPAFTASRKIR